MSVTHNKSIKSTADSKWGYAQLTDKDRCCIDLPLKLKKMKLNNNTIASSIKSNIIYE